MNITGIRDFRRNLKEHLNGTETLILGNRWHPRAVLIPMLTQTPWEHRNRTRLHRQWAKKAKAEIDAIPETLHR